MPVDLRVGGARGEGGRLIESKDPALYYNYVIEYNSPCYSHSI